MFHLPNMTLYHTLQIGAITNGLNDGPLVFSGNERIGLHWIDWIIIGVYIALILGLGIVNSLKDKSVDDYFLARRKHISPVFIGISLFATLLSTITYLASPGEVINKGPVSVLSRMMVPPIAFAIVGYLLIPALMRIRVTSAYELLEERLGLGVRLLGAGVFIGLRLAWMGLLVHIASIALTVSLGLDDHFVIWMSAITGLVAILYTAIGGLRTVIMTDFIQFCLLAFGAIITILLISLKMGFSWWPTEWSPAWDVQPFFSLDPTVRVTFVGGIITGVFWMVATAGSDQTAVQRYMATENAAAARRSYLIHMIAFVGVHIILALLGLALLGFFSTHPEGLAPGMSVKADGDQLFPYFIANFLPIGISGLLVAAILAAAMSSMDSGVNSITAVVTTDFLKRFGYHPKTDQGNLLFSKGMALSIGIVAVFVSTLVHHVPGNFVEMTTKLSNLVVSPLFVLFILALWVPFATPLGAFLGFAYGLAAAILIGFWDVLTGQPRLSFQWLGPCSAIVNLVVALAVCRYGPRRGNFKGQLAVGIMGIAVLMVILILLL